MENNLRENAYIEGLLVALNQAAPISRDLEFDLTIDLHVELMLSKGLFVSAKVKPSEDNDYQQLDVFVITSSDGRSCVPVFTNPKVLEKFMDECNELRAGDLPFAIMSFPQIYEMAMNLPMDITGIVLNPDEQSERIFTFADMEEVLMAGAGGNRP